MQEKVDLIDVLSIFKNKVMAVLFDGLHPNSEGHKLIFEAVRDYLLSKNLFNLAVQDPR